MKLAIRRRERPHSLAGAYALDALDGTEQERFERHLRGCASCRDEVRGFAAVTAALAEAATAVPPAGLRDRVLAAVTVIQQLPAEVPARQAGREVRNIPTSRSPWLPRLALAAGAAGLAAAAVLGGITVSARHGQSGAQAQAQAISAILTAPDARLLSVPTSAGGRATVVASVSQGKMVFTSTGLRPLTSARVYELWFVGKTTRPAGLVPPAVGGKTAPVLVSGLSAGDTVSVTVEPAGGSSVPTTAPIVAVRLTA
jgi:anti-sigma-K factor RskA